MQIIKALGDGIGTAAGVAWPTFGIVFGALSLTVAGSTAIVLGLISLSLFLMVAAPISIWSYNNYYKEKHLLKRDLQKQLILAQINYLSFILILIQECIIENEKIFQQHDFYFLTKNLKEKILDQLSNEAIKLSQHSKDILRNLLDHPNFENLSIQIFDAISKKKLIAPHEILKLLSRDNATELKHHIKNIIHIHEASIIQSQFKPSTSYLVKIGISSFCAAFGSIAGCAAGTMGMLTSIGIFAGLAAVPILGWALLGTAVVFGLVVAKVCIYYAYQKEINLNKLKHRTESNNNLEILYNLKQVRIETQIEFRKKYLKKIPNNSTYRMKQYSNTKNNRSQSPNYLGKNRHSIWKTSSESIVDRIARNELNANPFLRESNDQQLENSLTM